MEKSHYKRFKGTSTEYVYLHNWVDQNLGVATRCEYCGGDGRKEWCNVSQEYKRDLSDWIQLCISCHRRFDNPKKWKWDSGRWLKLCTNCEVFMEVESNFYRRNKPRPGGITHAFVDWCKPCTAQRLKMYKLSQGTLH